MAAVMPPMTMEASTTVRQLEDWDRKKHIGKNHEKKVQGMVV